MLNDRARGMSKEEAAAYWLRNVVGVQRLDSTRESCRTRSPERTSGIEKLSMQPLTGYPVSSLQCNHGYHHTTRGRHPKMRVRLKGINWSIKKLADGTSKTYWYAWKGGPRIDAEPGTPEFMRLYNEAVASYKKKSAETFSSLIDYFKDCNEYKDLGEKSKRAYDGYLKLIEAKFGSMPIGALERSLWVTSKSFVIYFPTRRARRTTSGRQLRACCRLRRTVARSR